MVAKRKRVWVGLAEIQLISFNINTCSLATANKKGTDLEKIVIKQRDKPVEKPDPDEKSLGIQTYFIFLSC